MINAQHTSPTIISREQILAAIAQVTPEERAAEARRRMEKALAHIEAAQGQLNDACAELSTLIGAIPVWKAAGTLADRVKAFWYRVRAMQKYQLDAMHVEALARQKAGLPRV